MVYPLADDRRILPLERTGEILHAPPTFMLVVSYNPGYQNLLKGMKPSTRQRFIALQFNFPSPVLERAILSSNKTATVQKASCSEIISADQSIPAQRSSGEIKPYRLNTACAIGVCK